LSITNFSFFNEFTKLFKHIKWILYLFFVFQIFGVIGILTTDKFPLHLYINTYHTTFWDHFFKYVTYLGDGITFGIAIIFVFFWSRKKTPVFIYAGISTLLMSFILKNYLCFNYPRPYEVFGDQLHLVQGVIMRHWHSFPSGHSMSAFALFFVIIFYTKKIKWQLLWFSLAVMAAISRVYLSQHFVEDILGGAFIGFLIALLSFLLSKRFSNTKDLLSSN
jgi:membrane-associated phospholipid phosphatase